MARLTLLATIFSLFLVHSTLAVKEAMPTFTVSKVFTTRGGIHTTTRGTIRLVFVHEGKWLVFHSGPNMYHFSPDGIHWTGQESSLFGSRNHLIRGNTIYSFAATDIDADPEKRKMVKTTYRGTIRGETIDWGEPYQVPHLTVGYYEDLQQDSTGRFTVSGRVPHWDDEGKVTGITIEWARSLYPNDITAWGLQQQVIYQVSDMKSSEIHENVPLDDGKSYIIGMLSVNEQGRLYGNLFDGENWNSEDTLLAENMSTVRGTDKRMSAVWDPQAKVIHLSYVDQDSNLWYRTCKSPYRAEDWSEPVKLKPFKVFTNVMSLDTTKTPAHLWLLYGKTLFEHPDPRWQSGELYLMKFDGESWGEPVLVSEPGTKYNWYPNMNEDISKGIGVLYLKGMPNNQAAIKNTDFDIMFSSTGAPQKALELGARYAGVTDVLVDGENCRGAHVTTRPHNRKVVYHAPSRTWFVFYGTGHWMDKLGDAGLEKEMIAWRSSKDGKIFNELTTAVVGNGHSSSTDVLIVGDRIYLSDARFGYWRSKKGIPALMDGKHIWHPDRMNPEKPNFYAPYEIFPFDIVGDRVLAGKEAEVLPGDKHIGHAGPHYGSITRDTNGYLWVAARALIEANGRLATWVSRTTFPDDIANWEPHYVLFESKGPGTHAPQILALDKGRVACVLFVKHEKMTVLYLYDPNSRTWDEPHIIGKGYQSKRACAVFDPGSRRLHVVYTDVVGDARH